MLNQRSVNLSELLNNNTNESEHPDIPDVVVSPHTLHADKLAQLKELRQIIGILERGKRTVMGARLKFSKVTKDERHIERRLSLIYDELKQIQDSIQRRYF